MVTINQNQMNPARVGLFGGTFNPIHLGHIKVAEEVLGRFDLDHIYFIPSAIPPHKAKTSMAPATDRLVMTRLALQDRQRLHVSDIEIQRRGTSYTIETLRWFKNSEISVRQYFFIIGMDAFLEIHTWKDYIELFGESAFIIMSRPQSDEPLGDFAGIIETYAYGRISKRYAFSEEGQVLRHPELQPLHLAQVTPIDIASTRIRQAVGQGRSINPWVDAAVAEYIEEKGLYR